MPLTPIKYYFRIRENGALVFRMNEKTRHLRMELKPIASVNVRNGDIKPHGMTELSTEDIEEIQAWTAARQIDLRERDVAKLRQLVDEIGLTTNWIQSKAADHEIEAVVDDLLLAMFDLRSVLTRKKSELMREKSLDANSES